MTTNIAKETLQVVTPGLKQLNKISNMNNCVVFLARLLLFRKKFKQYLKMQTTSYCNWIMLLTPAAFPMNEQKLA